MKKWFAKNLWLKVVALILAIITWFYVDQAIKQAPSEERLPFWVGYAPGHVIKRVKITPAIAGKPSEGYVLRMDRMRVSPETTFIIGPKRLVDKVGYLKTVEIDVTGFDRTYSATVPLESVEGVRFYGAGGIVDVTIPIHKIQQQ